MICFGEIVENRETLIAWQGSWAELTTSPAWNKTGHDKLDFEGIDWDWVKVNKMIANFSLASKTLQEFGFRKSLTEFGSF